MTSYGRSLLLGILVVSLAAAPGSAGELKLEIKAGRVTLVAEDVTLRRILDEWARVGRTTVINSDALSGCPVTLQLISVPEKLALEIILRPASGYIAATRHAESPGPSFYDRIVGTQHAHPATVSAEPLDSVRFFGTAILDRRARVGTALVQRHGTARGTGGARTGTGRQRASAPFSCPAIKARDWDTPAGAWCSAQCDDSGRTFRRYVSGAGHDPAGIPVGAAV